MDWKDLSVWQSWVLGIGGSLGAAFLLWLGRKAFLPNREPSEAPPAIQDTVQQMASPVITVYPTINPTFSPTINIGSVGDKPVVPKAGGVDEVRSLFTCQARRARVEPDEGREGVILEADTGPMTALVSVRNKSSKTAKDVSAEIYFQSETDRNHVLIGCWLGTKFSTVWIEPSIPQQLVIVAHLADETRYITLDCRQHEVNDPYRAPIPRNLDAVLHRVKIVLHVGGRDEEFTFTLNLAAGEFSFVLS